MLDDPPLHGFHAGDLPAHSRILVAVSGGPDSMALLHALLALAPARGWSLRMGHVNHRLRNAESATDESFVRAVAGAHGLRVDVAAVDTAEYAAEHRLSVETAARALRYAALRDMLSRWPGDLIATGHTLDDQAETVLMRLLRGAGLTGLAAMRAHTEDIVRPLLAVRHEEVIRYLQTHDVAYRLDQSNTDRRRFRNRIRHDLMPAFEWWAPGAPSRLGRTAHLLQADAAYLEAETVAAIDVLSATHTDGICLAGWRALHPSLRRNVLRLLLARKTARPADLDAESLLRLERTLLAGDQGSTAGSLPRDLHVSVREGRLDIREPRKPLAGWDEMQARIPGETPTPAGTVVAEFLSGDERCTLAHMRAVLGPWHALFDPDALGTDLRLRPRRPGDRMTPLGAPGRRKLQDIMVDRRVPAELRETWPLVVAGDDILWIPAIARSETALLGQATSRALLLRIRPAPQLLRGRIPRYSRQI